MLMLGTSEAVECASERSARARERERERERIPAPPPPNLLLPSFLFPSSLLFPPSFPHALALSYVSLSSISRSFSYRFTSPRQWEIGTSRPPWTILPPQRNPWTPSTLAPTPTPTRAMDPPTPTRAMDTPTLARA